MRTVTFHRAVKGGNYDLYSCGDAGEGDHSGVYVQREVADDLIAVLTKIACFDDAEGNKRLATTGKYYAFDEPASVQLARETLAKIKQ